MIAKVQGFIAEVFTELKKVSWTTPRELRDATIIVIFSSFFLGIFIALIDFALSKGIFLIVR